MSQHKQMFVVGIIAMTDIRRLDGKLLQAFDVLMEERSVTRAARHLNMTQQGMSGVLQRLRDVFSDVLFVRAAQGISPTPRAEELAPLIRSALDSLNAVASSDVFDPALATGTIRLATSDYGLTAIVSPLFRRFRKTAPNVRLVVVPRSTENLSTNIRNGRVDLVLTIPRFLPAMLHRQKLYDENYLCVVRAGHALAKKGFDLDAFCECEHLLISSDGEEFMSTTDIALARLDRSRKIGLTIPSYGVATDVVRQTDFIAVLPQSILKRDEKGLRIFAPPLDVEGFELVMAWPERVAAASLHMWFRGFLDQFTRTGAVT